MVDSLGIESIQIPHQRQPPKRYTGGASQSAEEHYRTELYKMIDCVDAQLQDSVFNQPGLDVLQKLEEILLTGKVNDIVDHYPELNRDNLKVQLAMFRTKNTLKSRTEVANIMRGMAIEVRGLFDQVETLVRLLLVIPVSSAEAERSFSALRRLQTWLRSTMAQLRLNSIAVCHVHQDKLDKVDVKQICQQFISVNDRRRYVFGYFK